MATIEAYETKAGTRYRVRYRKPDRRQTDKRGFKTKRDAKNFAATVETRKMEGLYVDPALGKETVGTLGQAWLDNLTAAVGTKEVYQSAWTRHIEPTFGTMPVNQVTYDAVNAWITALRKTLGASSIRRAHRLLAGILDDAVAARRIAINPARQIKRLPTPTARKNVYLTYTQVETLATVAGHYRIAVYLAAYIGLRYGEIKALTGESVDMKKRRIVVESSTDRKRRNGPTKSGKPRSVGYPGFLHTILRDAVLASGGGALVEPFPPPRDKGWWGTMRKNAGLPKTLHFHDLRHSAASFAISAGAHPLVVANMLGHANPSITLRVYSDLFDTDVDDVAKRIGRKRKAEMGKMWAGGKSG